MAKTNIPNMTEQPDWADERAERLLGFIKASDATTSRGMIAAYLRLAFCEGEGSGLRKGAVVVDRFFFEAKKERALACST